MAQTGCDSDRWPEMAFKELLDNALDAAESSGVSPVLTVEVDDESILVVNNGPGIPLETACGTNSTPS